MTRIACVGITVLDRIWYIDDLPKCGSKHVAKNYTEVGGGPAATAAVAAAKLGAEVDFIGRVGDDDTGHRLLSELESWGVNTGYTRIYENARSSQSAILVDNNGERIIANFPSPDLPDTATWLNDIDFSQYDAVLADVRWHEGAKHAFTLARQHGVLTVLDGDITPQNIADLVELSDHAVFSAPGLERLIGINDREVALKKAKKITNGHVYVTFGEDGCYWIENETLHHQSAFPVNVVDTTGAGDVFHGAMVVSLAQQLNPTQAVRFSSAVAALKCTKPGGRAGIPDQEQTRTFLSLLAE
ncbi:MULTISPECIES: sugar kinase [Klebsiella pneumoniae complex]|uniref:sugar kinase n=1 Tax=Klebsiella pneumoniae complex TaxID=3390273 RepID=UPI0003BFC8B5|nr:MULTISPECIES: sugar kinase [Klebsiella]ESM63062.1 hypothetical protein L390_01750 [Klebsiella quasipneumoniae subsp. similipneumoniae]KDL58478.1 hypothetical protein AD94_03072 [Klebsiella variicola]QNC78347.1 ribokinase [Klebsiella quasipneumoniae]HDK6209653.1 sugar kinase [Klebsiella quasipneumoniae]